MRLIVAGHKVLPVWLVHKGMAVPRDLQVRRERREDKVLPVRPELLVPLVQLARLVLMEHKGRWVRQARRVLKVLQERVEERWMRLTILVEQEQEEQLRLMPDRLPLMHRGQAPQQ